MKPSALLFCALGVLVALRTQAWADTTCNSGFDTGTDPNDCNAGVDCPMENGIHPIYCRAILCDDFDRWCVGVPQCPPEPPNNCVYVTGNPVGPAVNDVNLRKLWRRTSFNELPGDYNELAGTETKVEPPNYNTTTGEWKLATGASEPQGMRYPNGGSDGDDAGQESVDLRPWIEVKHGVENSTIKGTDAAPLILSYTMSSGIQGASGMGYNTGYMELAFQTNTIPDPDAPPSYPAEPEDDSRTPMDFVRQGDDIGGDPEGCFTCYNLCPGPNFGPHISWQTVCQAYVRSPLCPPDPVEPHIWNVLAVGCNALLDTNPCHCENPADQVPYNSHLSFFDGYKWMILSSSNVAGYTGTFTYGDKRDDVTITVKSSTVDIYHRANVSGTHNCVGGFCTGGGLVGGKPCTANNQCKFVESYRTGIPRQYPGVFNRLRVGTAIACELRDYAYQCIVVGGASEGGVRRPLRMGEPRCDGGGLQQNKAGNLIFDNVFLKDGLPGGAQTGACCNDGACTEVLQAACTGSFSGEGSTCANEVCCPEPWADTDNDGDVDMDDHGAFQTCYTGDVTGLTGQCTCFDKDHNNKLDEDDFTAFTNCFTGPTVQFIAANLPNCLP